jgi:hypothetical protein
VLRNSRQGWVVETKASSQQSGSQVADSTIKISVTDDVLPKLNRLTAMTAGKSNTDNSTAAIPALVISRAGRQTVVEVAREIVSSALLAGNMSLGDAAGTDSRFSTGDFTDEPGQSVVYEAMMQDLSDLSMAESLLSSK